MVKLKLIEKENELEKEVINFNQKLSELLSKEHDLKCTIEKMNAN